MVPESRWSLVVAVVLHGVTLAALWRPSAPAAAAPAVLVPDTPFPDEDPLGDPPPGPVFPVPGPSGPVLLPPGTETIPGVPPLSPTTPGDPRTLGPIDESRGGGPGVLWAPELVQEAPTLLTAPVPAYPARLREAGIQGRVVLEAIVDTLGRVEPGSLRVVASDRDDFNAPAIAAIGAALFRPARVFGRPVRVLVRVPVAFRLR